MKRELHDLISRSALERKLSDERAEWTPAASYHIGYCNGLVMAKSFVAKAPAVDAVEVVRCRECKFRKPTFSGENYFCTVWDADESETAYVTDDDFCSYGERRLDND